MTEETGVESLAPAPDFRYVGLEPGPRSRVGLWASATLGLATLGAGLVHGVTVRGVVLTAIAAVAGGLALRKVGGPHLGKAWSARGVPMGIVPWGILVEQDDQPRVLRWAAVEKVHVEMLHGRDQGTPTTLWSVVTITTNEGETLVGRAADAVSLDRLLAHLSAYAAEQGHVPSLDLDGERAGEGPLEPECEPLLAAARNWLDSAEATGRLDLPPAGYRSGGARAVSPRALEVLSDVLCDRRARSRDPRAFAVACAAELAARELADDIVALVQSPHPILSAVAKSAARKLGVATARAGSLDEVAPFLMEKDVEALRGWAGWDVAAPG
jgi:hypothetical protein